MARRRGGPDAPAGAVGGALPLRRDDEAMVERGRALPSPEPSPAKGHKAFGNRYMVSGGGGISRRQNARRAHRAIHHGIVRDDRSEC